MVEAAEKTGEKKTALDSFLEISSDTGNVSEKEVFRAALELAKPDYKPQLDTLRNLRTHAEAHRAKKQARVEDLKVKYAGDQDLLDNYVGTEEKALNELIDFITDIDAKLVALEASSKIDGRADAILAEMKKKGEVTAGGEKAARYTALIIEGLRGDNNELFAQAAQMMQEMFAQAGPGGSTTEKVKEPEGRTTAEAAKLIKENLEAVKAAFGSRLSEGDIDNLKMFADGTNPGWQNPIKWIQQARGVDFKARLMKMADVAEKAAQEKDVAPVFAELGMGDPDLLIPKYAAEIKAKGIKGVPETYTDNNGDSHPLRDMLKAHLLVMVDFGLIKHEIWMDDLDAQEARQKVTEKLGKTHSDQLLAYYKRRLKTIEDAFPSVKQQGDGEPVANNNKEVKKPKPIADEDTSTEGEGQGKKKTDTPEGRKDDKGELTAKSVAEKLGITETRMNHYRDQEAHLDYSSAGIIKLTGDIESIPETDDKRAEKLEALLGAVNPDSTYGPAIMVLEMKTPDAVEAKKVLKNLIDAIDKRRK